METLEITEATAGWEEAIRAKLRDGQRITVKFQPVNYTPNELAEKVGVTRPTIMRYINDGSIKAIRRGNRHLIPLLEANRFVSSYAGS